MICISYLFEDFTTPSDRSHADAKYFTNYYSKTKSTRKKLKKMSKHPEVFTGADKN